MTSVKLINHSSSTADWNYLYIFLLLFKIELKKNELKTRIRAREKVFCLFAMGKRVLQFQFFVSTCYYDKNCS